MGIGGDWSRLNGKNAKKHRGFSENLMGLTIAGDFPGLWIFIWQGRLQGRLYATALGPIMWLEVVLFLQRFMNHARFQTRCQRRNARGPSSLGLRPYIQVHPGTSTNLSIP